MFIIVQISKPIRPSTPAFSLKKNDKNNKFEDDKEEQIDQTYFKEWYKYYDCNNNNNDDIDIDQEYNKQRVLVRFDQNDWNPFVKIHKIERMNQTRKSDMVKTMIVEQNKRIKKEIDTLKNNYHFDNIDSDTLKLKGLLQLQVNPDHDHDEKLVDIEKPIIFSQAKRTPIYYQTNGYQQVPFKLTKELKLKRNIKIYDVKPGFGLKNGVKLVAIRIIQGFDGKGQWIDCIAKQIKFVNQQIQKHYAPYPLVYMFIKQDATCEDETYEGSTYNHWCNIIDN